MLDPEILKILCCPETHQPIAPADRSLVDALNHEVVSGRLKNRAGQVVKEKLDGGLVREDRKFLYPVRQDIPVMLIEEAIPL
jgi:uncharacterized protein YbaR (Trm112 family)